MSTCSPSRDVMGHLVLRHMLTNSAMPRKCDAVHLIAVTKILVQHHCTDAAHACCSSLATHVFCSLHAPCNATLLPGNLPACSIMKQAAHLGSLSHQDLQPWKIT